MMHSNTKHFLLSIFLSTASLLWGCSDATIPLATQPPQAAGGVGVGNGMTSYFSPAYKFQVSYPQALKLTVRSPDTFQIDNSSLANIPAEKTSKIEFTVTEKEKAKALGIENIETLHRYLEQNNPQEKFEAIALPGASGFFTEHQTNDNLVGHYFFLTTNGDLVQVEIDANAFGNGLEWVSPIVRTFVYDGAAPLVLEIKAGARDFTAGQTGKIFFHSTDDYSGIDLSSVGGWFRPTLSHESSAQISLISHSLQSLGNNWYSVEFEIGSFKPEGEYLLEVFSIKDLGGNQRYLNAPTCASPTGLCGNVYHQAGGASVPLVKINVHNRNLADSDKPIVHELNMTKNSLRAGEKSTLYFRATDSNSGLTEGARVDGWFQPESGPSADPLAGNIHFRGNFTREVKPVPQLGADWYSLEFQVSEYLPSGKYILVTFAITDNATNERYLSAPTCARPGGLCGEDYEQNDDIRIPVLRLNVTNDGNADAEKPLIEALELKSQRLNAGQKGTIRFKASDDGSGLAGGRFHGSLQPMSGPDDNKNIHFSGYIGGPFSTTRDLGNGWYELDFATNEFLPAGEYVLAVFAVLDKAGNERYLVAPTCGHGLCGKEYGQAGSAKVPVVILTLVK